MPIPVILALSLLGCETQTAGDGLRLAPGSEEPEVSEWEADDLPQADDVLGDDVVATELCGYLWDAEGGDPGAGDTGAVDTGAGDTGRAALVGGETLELDWCLRVTPEPEDEVDGPEDTGVTTGGDMDPGDIDSDGQPSSCEVPADLPDDAPPPPCSFSNLVGSFRLAGPAAEPLLTYCDGDDDGGMRTVVRVDGEHIRNRIIDETACLPDPDSAAVVPEGDGHWLYYVEPDGADVGPDPVLARVGVAADGRVTTDRVALDTGTSPNSVQAVQAGSGTVLLVEGMDGSLAAVRPDAGERTVLLDDGVLRTAAVAVGDGIAVAACQDGGALQAFWLDADGAVAASRLLDDAGCDGMSRPNLATDGARAVLALHTTASDGGADGLLLPLTADLDAVDVAADAVLLAGDASFPAVAWDTAGQRFVSLDRTGAVRTWTADLAPGSSWVHPAVSGHLGGLEGFRLSLDADTWTFAVLGYDDEPTFPGHSNTFFWVELSSVPAP